MKKVLGQSWQEGLAASLEVLSRNLPLEAEESHKIFSQGSQSPSRDLKAAPP
jgi:hypothetical protein